MDNQYSYYNPNETEGNTSNGTTFYNNGLTSERELLKSSSQIWVSINTDDQGICTYRQTWYRKINYLYADAE